MKKKKTKKIKRTKGYEKAATLISLILLLAGLSLVVLWVKNSQNLTTQSQAGKIIMLYPNPETAKPNLQLQTFPYIMLPAAPSMGTPNQSNPSMTRTTITTGTLNPPAGGYCALDDIKPSGSTCGCLDSNAVACPATPSGPGAPSCSNGSFPMMLPPASGTWYCIQLGSPGLTEPNPPPPPSGCYAACIAKPVVYLYPEEKTLVDVSVTAPGEVFISDPLYPEGGWENVEAHPDGTLYYQGKKYKELFYETRVTKKIEMPETGVIIASDELKTELTRLTTQLGLIEHEQKEFLEYWVPTLQQLNSPYFYFSVFPPDIKESLDKLTVFPEPDTRIEFIAYFKPLKKPIAVKPLALPKTPPERIGFTEVEWGGTIDRF